METEKLVTTTYGKVLLGVVVSILGVTAGYAAASMTASDNPASQAAYCDNLEEQLVQEYNTSSLMCHEPGWVALSADNEEVENQTNIRCACTRIQDGDLTIFPIRVAD